MIQRNQTCSLKDAFDIHFYHDFEFDKMININLFKLLDIETFIAHDSIEFHNYINFQ